MANFERGSVAGRLRNYALNNDVTEQDIATFQSRQDELADREYKRAMAEEARRRSIEQARRSMLARQAERMVAPQAASVAAPQSMASMSYRQTPTETDPTQRFVNQYISDAAANPALARDQADYRAADMAVQGVGDNPGAALMRHAAPAARRLAINLMGYVNPMDYVQMARDAFHPWTDEALPPMRGTAQRLNATLAERDTKGMSPAEQADYYATMAVPDVASMLAGLAAPGVGGKSAISQAGTSLIPRSAMRSSTLRSIVDEPRMLPSGAAMGELPGARELSGGRELPGARPMQALPDRTANRQMEIPGSTMWPEGVAGTPGPSVSAYKAMASREGAKYPYDEQVLSQLRRVYRGVDDFGPTDLLNSSGRASTPYSAVLPTLQQLYNKGVSIPRPMSQYQPDLPGMAASEARPLEYVKFVTHQTAPRKGRK